MADQATPTSPTPPPPPPPTPQGAARPPHPPPFPPGMMPPHRPPYPPPQPPPYNMMMGPPPGLIPLPPIQVMPLPFIRPFRRAPPPPPRPPPVELPRGLPSVQPEEPEEVVVVVEKKPEESPMTVFVGKLPPNVPDHFVNFLLEQCGEIAEWKRAMDPNTDRPKNFGFCTYKLPMYARRAVKLLNKFKVDYQEIVVKIGKKEQELLDNMDLEEDEEKDEMATARLTKIIGDRNLGVTGSRGEGGGDGGNKKEEESTPLDLAATMNDPELAQEVFGGGDDTVQEKMEKRKNNPVIMSEIEKFRMMQADRDRRKEEDRVRQLKRRLEEQARREKLEAQREARVKARKEEEEAREAERKKRRKDASDSESSSDSSSSSDDSDGDRRKKDKKKKKKKKEAKRRKRSSRSRSRHRRRSGSRRRSRSRESKIVAAVDAQSLIKDAITSAAGGNDNADNDDISQSESSSSLNRPVGEENPSLAPPLKIEAGGRTLGIALGSKAKTNKSARSGNNTHFAFSKAGDDEEEDGKLSRPLIPIDYDEDDTEKGKASTQPATKSTIGSASASLSEKQKALIASIPEDKEALWAYPINWSRVEKCDIVQKKLRSWIVKKIKDLLGEEEKTLIDFICTKLKQHSSPQELFKELKLVLEDDAETFITKLWRILIFESISSS